MGETEQNAAKGEAGYSEPQPSAIVEFFKALGTARRLSSLYGSDHPNTAECLTVLSTAAEQLLEKIDRPTIVFMKEGVVVNDRCYASSNDSLDLFQRLRARGVMGVTIVSSPPNDQLYEFVLFLNIEPREVKKLGGPSEYLRRRRVTRIVVTSAIYSGGDEEESDGSTQKDDPAAGIDRAIGAVIDWLGKQEDEQPEDAEQLPIFEILSNPDDAAKLIREAVTKLHASRSDSSTQEVAGEVVNNLKSIASSDPKRWDESVPQVRRAISKLPQEIRPSDGAFNQPKQANEKPARLVDPNTVEAMVAETGGDNNRARTELSKLFGVRPNGMPAAWKNELRPESLMAAAGLTYSTLLAWENNASEHGRIAEAIASMVTRAVETEDLTSALQFVLTLAVESNCGESMDWRCINARGALDRLSVPVLKQVVEEAAKADDIEKRKAAATLVEELPKVAVAMVGEIAGADPEFVEALKSGLAKAGNAAIDPLVVLLRKGDPRTRSVALDVLIHIGNMSAAREIGAAIENCEDTSFVTSSLKRLPSLRMPQVTEICIKFLSHKTLGVRLAAIAAIVELKDESALPYLCRIASSSMLGNADNSERIAAIEALGQLGNEEEQRFLERMAHRNPILGRSKYQPVKQAASKAAAHIRERLASSTQVAA